jgi:RNA polymerase sigma-70 factor (ECF subfamily)
MQTPLLAYTRRRLSGDTEMACDVVQEAFVKLCQQSWPAIEPHAVAWLYKACRNRAIDITRREGRIRMHHTTDHLTALPDERQGGPVEQTEQEEQLERMRLQIEQLTDQQQELLRLRLHGGLSYKQIAEITGLTVTNVGYHLHQALACLRAQLGTDS